jgi:excisionase family DNA binding protein
MIEAMPVSKLLSVAQVSTKLQCARSTVRKLVASGLLRASRIGLRSIRISELDLRDYLESRANTPAVTVSVNKTRPHHEW